jgi:hypothetical protein
MQRGQFDDRLGLPLEQHRQHDNADPVGLTKAGRDVDEIGRHIGKQDAFLFQRALSGETLAEADAGGEPFTAMRVARQQNEFWMVACASEVVDGSLVRVDQRGQLGQEHLTDGTQLALALQHAGELGEIRLQPVLLAIALGRFAQVGNHRIDVVLEFGHFAAGLHLDGASQIALGHGSGDLGDRAHLCGQVGGEQVNIPGEILPCPRGTGDVSLAA